jgi:transcriptional regulator with XRE-family HTH domain
MKLKDFLYFENISITDFAKKIGISRGHISGIVNGFRQPGKMLILQIKHLTNGKVCPEDFEMTKNNLLEKK